MTDAYTVETSEESSIPAIKIDPEAYYRLDDMAKLLSTYDYKLRERFRDLELPMSKDGVNTYVKGANVIRYLDSMSRVLPKRGYTKTSGRS